MRGMRCLWRFAAAAIAFGLAVSFTGCKKNAEVSSEPQPMAAESVPPLLDVDISSLLTSEQVGQALGISVDSTYLLDDDTAVRYTNDAGDAYAEIAMMKCERGVFDETVAAYEDAADSPNLGEASKWSASAGELLVYGSGYMIGITVASPEKSADSLLVSARQLAALILEKPLG